MYKTSNDYLSENPHMVYSDAVKIMKRHGVLWYEFATEFGDCSSYSSEDVLAWLGY
jgi:hypothetical protein